jgi:myo-inositol-1(or 4)-monophosphatase
MAILDEILAVAKEAGEAAQKVQLQGWTQGTTVRNKGQAHDLVTAADVEAESQILQIVRKHFPDHGFLGEESGEDARNSEWLWIVDPIDGTTNFARGLAYFSVSIAVVHQSKTVVGLVVNPVLGETFWAVEGQGAFLNGRRLECSKARQYTEALMITGFYYDRGKNIDLTLALIRRWYDRGIMGLRRFGSAALDLCQIAAGRADGYFEIGLNAWDFAAGEFIARLAGAVVTDGAGNPLQHVKTVILAAAPDLHAPMLADWQEIEAQN